MKLETRNKQETDKVELEFIGQIAVNRPPWSCEPCGNSFWTQMGLMWQPPMGSAIVWKRSLRSVLNPNGAHAAIVSFEPRHLLRHDGGQAPSIFSERLDFHQIWKHATMPQNQITMPQNQNTMPQNHFAMPPNNQITMPQNQVTMPQNQATMP